MPVRLRIRHLAVALACVAWIGSVVHVANAGARAAAVPDHYDAAEGHAAEARDSFEFPAIAGPRAPRLAIPGSRAGPARTGPSFLRPRVACGGVRTRAPPQVA